MTATASFTEATVVQERSRDGGMATFDADVGPGWTVGGRPNGGYLLAIMGRAAGAVGSHDEATTVWDRNGAVVAQATQLAGIRLGSAS